jgi:hypothetical protein
MNGEILIDHPAFQVEFGQQALLDRANRVAMDPQRVGDLWEVPPLKRIDAQTNSAGSSDSITDRSKTSDSTSSAARRSMISSSVGSGAARAVGAQIAVHCVRR